MDTIGWFQLIPLIAAAGLSLSEFRYDKDDEESARRRVVRVVSLVVLLVAMAGIVIGRIQSRREQSAREAVLQQQLEHERELLQISHRLEESQNENLKSQKETLNKAGELADSQTAMIDLQSKGLDLSKVLKAEQLQGNEQITRLSKDRYLSGIEISYKPSAAQWERIVNLYRKIEPGDGEKSYYDTPIIAERLGDRWKVDFEPVDLKEGQKWFPYVYTNEKEHQAFESVIREACIGLLVKWGDVSQIDIEPMRSDYPAVVTISKNAIAMTLRPPNMALYLGDLRDEAIVVLRGRKEAPTEIRFKSLDASVIFDETLKPVWTKQMSHIPRERVKPYVSTPQKIHVIFRTI